MWDGREGRSFLKSAPGELMQGDGVVKSLRNSSVYMAQIEGRQLEQSGSKGRMALHTERWGAMPSAAELRGTGREGCWIPQPGAGMQPGLTATACCTPVKSLLQFGAISGDQLLMRIPSCTSSLDLTPNWEFRAESPHGNSHGISSAGKIE